MLHINPTLVALLAVGTALARSTFTHAQEERTTTGGHDIKLQRIVLGPTISTPKRDYNYPPQLFERATDVPAVFNNDVSLWGVDVVVGGDGGQKVLMAIDSGSDKSWLYNNKCTSAACKAIGQQHLYKQGGDYAARGGVLKLLPALHRYEDKEWVWGKRSTATFDLGAGMTLAGAPFTSASKGTASFFNPDVPPDRRSRHHLVGMLGMGRSRDAIWYKLLKALGEPTWYAVHVDYSAELAHVQSAKLTLGGFDPSCISDGGGITWVNTIGKTFWTVPLDGVVTLDSDGNEVELHDANGKPITLSGSATIDTGTNWMTGPKAQIERFYKEVYGSCEIEEMNGLILCRLPRAATPERVVLKFGNARVALPVESLHIDFGRKRYGTMAMGTRKEWIFGGNAFMRAIYLVFKAGGQDQVGFAPSSRRC